MIVNGVEFSEKDLATVVREHASLSSADDLRKRAASHRALADEVPLLAGIHGGLAVTFERLAEVAVAMDAEQAEYELRAAERARDRASS